MPWIFKLHVLTDSADELNFDAGMLEPLAIFGSDGNSSFDRLSIHVQGSLFPPILIQFDIHHRPVIGVLEDDVDIDWG